jgi:hypothetical protein
MLCVEHRIGTYCQKLEDVTFFIYTLSIGKKFIYCSMDFCLDIRWGLRNLW